MLVQIGQLSARTEKYFRAGIVTPNQERFFSDSNQNRKIACPAPFYERILFPSVR